MPPSDHLAAGRGPRHSSEPARHARPDDPSAPRHRRPETLADAPAGPAPAAIWAGSRWSDAAWNDSGATGSTWSGETRTSRRRRAEAEFHPADEEILAARQAAQLHSGLVPAPVRSHLTGPSRVERRRQERESASRADRRRDSESASRADRRRSDRDAGRHTAPRGRHARPADPLNITVRPTGAARPPVTGSRRAPGTLPIESWLLIGKGRQQALLASLVAVGLALVMIPVAQQDDPVNPVNAAGQATVATKPAAKAKAKPSAVATEKPAQQPAPTDKDQPPATTPTVPPTEASKPPPPSAEVHPVPPGDGPFRSLKTTGTDTVALTFDDGPDPVQTPKILAMLDAYQVKATFCLVGEQVAKHPDIVQQIVAAGHTLCNHTWDHSLTIGKDKPAVIEADLARTNQAIHNAVPGVEIPFFRAPGGNFSDRLVRVAYAGGMTSLYWQVDPRDWEHDKKKDDKAHIEKVVADVREGVKPGSIVLSHDFNQPDTIIAYEQLLPWLAENFQLGIPPVAGPAGSAGR